MEEEEEDCVEEVVLVTVVLPLVSTVQAMFDMIVFVLLYNSDKASLFKVVFEPNKDGVVVF